MVCGLHLYPGLGRPVRLIRDIVEQQGEIPHAQLGQRGHLAAQGAGLLRLRPPEVQAGRQGVDEAHPLRLGGGH